MSNLIFYAQVGWSPASNRADGKAINGPPPVSKNFVHKCRLIFEENCVNHSPHHFPFQHPDRMNKYMRDKSARQSEAVAGLVWAIAAGEEAERWVESFGFAG